MLSERAVPCAGVERQPVAPGGQRVAAAQMAAVAPGVAAIVSESAKQLPARESLRPDAFGQRDAHTRAGAAGEGEAQIWAAIGRARLSATIALCVSDRADSAATRAPER